MHVHFLGICGTFMASLALLTKAQGHTVSGQDRAAYPPMSSQLTDAGIDIHLTLEVIPPLETADIVVVGNIMRRGMACVEYLLETARPLYSGPQYVAMQILQQQHVCVISGTHGKTTTSSMLAWILQVAGLAPGYLIGGLPYNFSSSAALGQGRYFVIEGDEYDSAFFDKRSKFIHYRPKTLVINNLEYDHADIFANLAAIQQQFSHLLRLVPQSGVVITPYGDAHIDAVLAEGCWARRESFGTNNAATWCLQDFAQAWPNIYGQHNRYNALAAIAAAASLGVAVPTAVQALASFRGVAKRLEFKGQAAGISVYVDFAHHPTAVQATLTAVQESMPKQRYIVWLDLCSNTMRSGQHQTTIVPALAAAHAVYLFHQQPIQWDLAKLQQQLPTMQGCYNDPQRLIDTYLTQKQTGDCVILMSNGAFAETATLLLQALNSQARRFGA
jgi:UDP-N-acetylmuramate: L-alanyl-gamma-D-glutamyl-meso-diaminopimelate ligase